MIRLSPASTERRQAQQWMRERGRMGLDGIIAKRMTNRIVPANARPW